MFEFLIFILSFLCPDPTHTPSSNCPGFHIYSLTADDEGDVDLDDDTGGETGTVPPNPPPPPPPPPRP